VGHIQSNRLRCSDKTRSAEAKQLDEGVVDTLESVGATSGAHTPVSIKASDSARNPLTQHAAMLLFEGLADLASIRKCRSDFRRVGIQTNGQGTTGGFWLDDFLIKRTAGIGR
jgi:hypothetical protein